MEKLRQSITARGVFCVMLTAVALVAIDPVPATNWPPCGSGPAASALALIAQRIKASTASPRISDTEARRCE
ncbi:hypothetical protein [Caballeronia sp. LZ031]|uniref:hypothetical protein n=1 Tax=Caballeronia sp. LZ031 TaxID=3038556 RepID=UPI00285E3A4E|nr:hypothetical protein [Caballeronia sp. LZ031]MDR5841456.1 hypothetical protein [Caballeronia sp. LZ031]